MATCTLSARVSVTGDCLNTGSGAFTIDIVGNTPPFYYQMTNPTVGAITPLGVGVTSFTQTNLTPDTYTYVISDSCAGTPTQVLATAVISDGVCASIYGHTDTTCNFSNGTITAQTDNDLANTNYFLYENTVGYISSGNSSSDLYVFPNLSAGTYYVTVDDGGGCSGKSETCIIKSSSELDFGFYIVNDTGCDPAPGGKLYVTGATGLPPYIYQWSPNPTGNPIPGISSLTGLTAGAYQLTLTDSTGCQVTKVGQVSTVPAVSVINYSQITPTCTSNDGQIQIQINGGTPPYNYIASNGETLITFDQIFTLTGLSSGVYTISVTDAGLCTTQYTYTLTPPNGFSILQVGIVNSTCNNSSGALNPITLVGGTPPFTYTLTYPSGNSIQQTVNGFSNQFLGLSAGTYTLTISNTSCSFTNTYTINNTEKFTVSSNITGSTCDTNNGAVRLILSTGGTAPYTYQFQGQPTISSTSQTAVTFNNLFAGTYLVSVSDVTNCTQTQTIIVPDVPSIDFTLVPTDASNINNGQVQTYITDGPPPYTVSWISNNVNGQTGLTLTNLSAGTYTALITDGNGCQLTRSTTIYGYNSFGTYGIFDYCESTLQYNGVVIPKKIPQMYVEGYYDLVSGETNCILNEAIFYSQVSLAGVSAETEFYTSNSLGDYPSDNEWFDAIRDALLSYPVIGNVIILPNENQITIQTNCSDLSLSLDNSQVTVALKISYDISCVCNIPPIPGPPLGQCDMIYIQPSSEVYYYEYSSDTSTLLSVESYSFNSPSVVFNNNKMWLYNVGVGTSTISEWDITTNPFTASYNRSITVNFTMGNAIGIKSSNVLITTNTDVSPHRYVELNITNPTPVITNQSYLLPDEEVIGSIVNDNNGTLYVLIQNNSNAPSIEYYLKFVSSVDYSLIYLIDLTPYISSQPTGLFTDPSLSNDYILMSDNSGNIYRIFLGQPSQVVSLTTISGVGSMSSLYQVNTCFTPNLTLPALPCGEDINSSWFNPDVENAGAILNQRINVGTNTGVLEMTVGFATSNIRYQILWNGTIVADSLFLTNSSGPFAHIIDVGIVTGVTQWYNFIYTPGTGNSTYAVPYTDWTDNGVSTLQFTPNDCADESAIRLFGSAGNQIGVVPSYPDPPASADNSNIKLQFTKTSAYPDYVDVVIYIAPSSISLISSGSFRNIIPCL